MRKIAAFVCSTSLMFSVLCYADPPGRRPNQAVSLISNYWKARTIVLVLGTVAGYLDAGENRTRLLLALAISQFWFAETFLDN